MRPAIWARWATCALAITIAVPAMAEHHGKSLSDCTSFDQTEKGESAVELTLKNTCSIPVDCSISWRVVCAPESKKRRSVHAGEAKLALVEGATQQAEASASVCGDDSYSIDSISWRCEPNKE